MSKRACVELPTSPEKLQQLLSNAENATLFLQLLNTVTTKQYGFNSKGDYLHWDDFLTRSAPFKGHQELAYYALKINRGLQPHAQLCDEHGRPFVLTENGLMAKLRQAERLLTVGELYNLTPTEQKMLLATHVVMEEAIASAQLEGAATTRKVAKAMLEQERAPRDLSEQMILNNWHLMQACEGFAQEPLTLELIARFNAIATDNALENQHIAGQFRTESIFVKNAVTQEVVHEAPAAQHIEPLLKMLCDYANNEHNRGGDFIHPIIKACALHFLLAYIHPFMDGNGRTARALCYLFMAKSGYEHFKYVSISALLKNAPTQYMRSFVYTETDGNDLTHFLDYQLSIIIKATTRLGEYVQHKLQQQHGTIESLQGSPYFAQLGIEQMAILDQAIRHAGRTFTVKELARNFDVSASAARTYLEALAMMGLLIKFKLKGRQFGYIAPADLRQRLQVD